MARAVMEAFPALPIMSFGTSKKEMACERRKFALSILNASVFHMENNCAMCSASKPPGSGPPTTDWIQCDICERWFHEQCLGMNQDQLQEARASNWNCFLCN
nr:lysine-specific demethylase 5B-B-like [Pseudochaenichthys georgianus]